MTEITDVTQAISIEKLNDRTVITYKKSKIVGSATSADVMNSVLIAARMQAEKYIEKLAKGTALSDKEVFALSQLAAITKIQTQPDVTDKPQPISATDVEILKSTFYAKLIEKKD